MSNTKLISDSSLDLFLQGFDNSAKEENGLNQKTFITLNQMDQRYDQEIITCTILLIN